MCSDHNRGSPLLVLTAVCCSGSGFSHSHLMSQFKKTMRGTHGGFFERGTAGISCLVGFMGPANTRHYGDGREVSSGTKLKIGLLC